MDEKREKRRERPVLGLGQVANYLKQGGHVGKRKSIRGRDLAAVLGIEERELRHMVSAEREGGTLILSGARGYFLAENRDEVKAFHDFMKRMAQHSFKMLKSARRVLDSFEGQLKMRV